MRQASFENTPILADGRLYMCSPFNEVSALEPGTGRQIWRFDPKLDTKISLSQQLYLPRGRLLARPGQGRQGACARRASSPPPMTAA